MFATALIEETKRAYAQKYGDKMTAKTLSDLMDDAESLILSMSTASAEDSPRNIICISINPDKFSSEDLIQIEDDWVNYIVNERGLNPSDAVMITPF